MTNLDIRYGDYKEENIYLATPDKKFVVKIFEGSGCNLEPEDEEEGFVDYWCVEGITSEGVECGGGFLYVKTSICEENQTLRQIIDMIKNSDALDEPELVKAAMPIDAEEGEALYEEFEERCAERLEKLQEELLSRAS